MDSQKTLLERHFSGGRIPREQRMKFVGDNRLEKVRKNLTSSVPVERWPEAHKKKLITCEGRVGEIVADLSELIPPGAGGPQSAALSSQE